MLTLSCFCQRRRLSALLVVLVAAPLFATCMSAQTNTQTQAQTQAQAEAMAQPLAPTPPMGWNSWDAYGISVNEEQYRSNAHVLASFEDYGWRYAVIDEGWFLANPADSGQPEKLIYTVDANGRNQPALNRFPSAANDTGFKPLADWTHAQGLKFGIHIIRGIPKGTVRANLPIADSQFHAADAADTSDTCPWNPDNFGVRESPAGQAWYDSIIRLYASWGVDFLKVDCIADHPYKAGEIRMIATAIRKTGRPILLSLSPGPASLENAKEIADHAQMWRIADDIWDSWQFTSKGWHPNGVLSAFDNLAKWSPYARPGNWPDADMLPWGYLGPTPGWGKARQSGLTADEQRTQFTLWAIARTPMILGANLTRLDRNTAALLTNRAVIRINQRAARSEAFPTPASLPASLRIWRAWSLPFAESPTWLAVFNLDDKPVTFDAPLAALGAPGGVMRLRNLFTGAVSAPATSVHVTLPAHGSVLWRLN